MSRPAHLAASLAATALLLAAALPAAAHAGTYNVTACNDAPGGVNNSWVPFNTDTAHLQTHLSCPYTTNQGQQANQENGIATTDILELPNGAQAGAQAGWKFEVPKGEEAIGISYERMFSTQDQYWIPALRADGTILPGQTCTPPVSGSCLTGSGPGGENKATITGLSAQTLTLGLQCTAPTGQECITGASGFHAAVATMYAATVTIEDNTPPTLTPPNGPLWENNPYHKATESVTVSAQDPGGGAQSIVLSADGHPAATYHALCDFTLPQPCPSSTGPQTLTLPTTELPDGTHTLTLTATDAAGNQSTVASTQITVANDPPPPPIGLTATATQASSTTFTATWSDPTDQIAPITAATYQLCPEASPGTCTTPAPAAPGGPTTITVPSPGTWTLAVWLTNAAGDSSPANAARTTLTDPADEPGGSSSTSHSGSTGGNSGPGGGSPGGGGSPSPKPPLQVAEALHGRKLTVRATGPPRGTVYITYTGRYHGKLIATATRKAKLRNGKLRVTFKLSTLVAVHSAIRVSARLDHHPEVTSTLHRHQSPAASTAPHATRSSPTRSPGRAAMHAGC